MQNALIAAGIILVLLILGIMLRTFFRTPLQCCDDMQPHLVRWSQDGFVGRCKSCRARLFFGDGENPTNWPLAMIREPEVTSSNQAAILAQIAGTPLGAMIASRAGATAYGRVRSVAMRDILVAAGSLEREELVQAAIRGGRTREIAEAYADEIISLVDPGEELPAAMAHAPNIGGEGHPDYEGGNYVTQGDLVDEMRGLIRYSGTGRGE